ncbi:hypothetical protein OP10G_2130 [Fimbriimonas ginsengisoli Gsoil 348]|uniref:Uncharacterized protein n=1 Tax=Fimbriimonas ginsengisoli Gsoil 348 TaxID=661478 RepID=A0A068NPM5_FIMGI|nr:hypothetical protein OP10G_2130 [Fimbriimonas ginsengisoli Gsoil 348]
MTRVNGDAATIGGGGELSSVVAGPERFSAHRHWRNPFSPGFGGLTSLPITCPQGDKIGTESNWTEAVGH